MIASAAQLLSDARVNHRRLTELPPMVTPKTPDEAYDTQGILIRSLLDHYGGHVIGYKIACTNPTAQRQLHVGGPFFGHLLSSFWFNSPARVRSENFFMRVVEAEFAFQMARDLPAASAPYEREEIADAVGGVIPGIEIVDSRFESWTTIGALS